VVVNFNYKLSSNSSANYILHSNFFLSILLKDKFYNSISYYNHINSCFNVRYGIQNVEFTITKNYIFYKHGVLKFKLSTLLWYNVLVQMHMYLLQDLQDLLS